MLNILKWPIFLTKTSMGRLPMLTKFKKIRNFLVYVFDGAVYGLIVYGVYTWLAGYSLLYAYLGNFVLIILALGIDALTFKYLMLRLWFISGVTWFII